MGNMLRRAIGLVVFITIAAVPFVSANGQAENSSRIEDYPNGQALRIVVPYGAGGKLDVKTRFVARYLSDELGVPVSVENRTGAGGLVAATEYLEEDPNTHTLIAMSLGISAVIPVYRDVPYTTDDFSPIIAFNVEPFGLFVNPEASGISSFEELIEFGQSNTIRFGGSAPGSDTYLVQASLFEMAGTDAVSVTQSSLGEGLTSTLGGHIEVSIAAMSLAEGFVEDGSLVPVAVYSDQPYTGFEGMEVPTIRSFGFDIEWGGFTWLAIRGGTDERVIDILYEAILNVYENPDFQAEMAAIGTTMDPMSPNEIIEYSDSKADLVHRLDELLPQ